MLKRIYLGVVLIAALPVCAQVSQSAVEIGGGTDDGIRMPIPPLVIGESYPAIVGDEERANFITLGVIFETAYDDNVLRGVTSEPVSDTTYSIRPTIAFDATTPRQHARLMYSPGFTFYHPTDALNESDEGVTFDYHYRLSEHATVGAQERFQKTSSVFSQVDTFLGGPVSGSPGPAEVVAPYADRDDNGTNGDISYQFSRDQLVGATGIYERMTYPNPTQAQGLYNSYAAGGSAFYSRRLAANQYIGVVYQYLRSVALPTGAKSLTETQAFNPYYTVTLKRRFSVLVAGGPQHVTATQTDPYQSSGSWGPSIMAGGSWLGQHTNFAATYSRTVAGGGGLLGAFSINRVSGSARWQMSKKWFLGGSGRYAVQKNAAPAGFKSSPGGHTISATVNCEHPIGERFKIEFGYDRLYQSYTGIAVLSTNPSSNREFFNISYQFSRPLGR